MKNPIMKLVVPTLAILALASIAIMTASRGDRGTIVSVHSEGVTEKFKVALGLPEGQMAGGRYAVVKIDDGAYGDASFALVYVPPQITVNDDNLVELNASGIGVLARPGSAVVSKVIEKRKVFFST